MTNIEHFRSEAEGINSLFPTLYYALEDGNPVITGLIQLKEDIFLIDQYRVRIIPSEDYPFRFPYVFETNGRIPHNIEWHVYPDGHSCIKNLAEEILISKKGIQLKDFINEQLIPYFFNQKHREMHGFFLHERKHGHEGNLEFFEELFDTKDLKTIGRGLLLLRDQHRPNRATNCFCGNGKKYRKCHKKALEEISIFSKDELEWFLKMIIDEIS